MKVYALYTGCRTEGGNVVNIYSTIEKAIMAALALLKKERKQEIKVMGKDSWEEAIDKYNDSIIKIWKCDLDEIIIYEYKIK